MFELIGDLPGWIRKLLFGVIVVPYIIVMSSIDIIKEFAREDFH